MNASDFGPGNAAEWATALVTGGLLIWTQLAWRKERQYARELENREDAFRRREAASQVSAWVQRVTPALQEDAALPAPAYPAGTWALCVANRSAVGLYDWRVSGSIGPPSLMIDESSLRHGPIGPGGQVTVSLARVDPAASPDVELVLRYKDESGSAWLRGPQGLIEEDPSTSANQLGLESQT